MPFKDPVTFLPADAIEGQFTSDQIADGAIIVGKLGPSAVTTAAIAAAAIDAEKIAAAAVTTAALAVGAVNTANIAAAAIDAEKIAAAAVTTAALAVGAVTNSTIAGSAVTASKIAANAVNASEIAAGAVVAGKIATGAVTAGTIAAGAVTAGTIAANAVTATEISANAVTAAAITANAITAGKIATGAVTAGTIAAGAVTAGTIAASTVTAAEISANAITVDKLTAGCVTAAKLDADAINGKTINGVTIIGTSTITGATVQTATSGKRIVLNSSGNVLAYSGAIGESAPGGIETGITTDGEMQRGYLVLKPPTHGTHTTPEVILSVGPTGERTWDLGPIQGLEVGSVSEVSFFGDVRVLSGGNIQLFSGTIKNTAPWESLSYGTGWTGHGPTFGLGHVKTMPDGSIRLRGLPKRTATTTPVSSELVFTLPAAYRPTNTTQFPIHLAGADAFVSLNIQADGTVRIVNISAAAQTYLATGAAIMPINGITWTTDTP